MADLMDVGDTVKFELSDCCMEASGQGVVTHVVTYAEDNPITSIDDYAYDADAIVAFTVGGVELRHPWGVWNGHDIEVIDG